MLFDFLKRADSNKSISEFEATSGAVLLDVRTGEEYREGHVPGSKNIEPGKISTVTSTITDKSTPLFVYCHSGSRSGAAVNTLKSMGYTNVRNIGGISSYTGTIERGA